MATIVRAYPLLPGKQQQLADFIRDVRDARRDETASFYQGIGVRRETWHLQHTEVGPMVIVATEVDDVDRSASEYQQADSAYDEWFKQKVFELSGFDPNHSPLGPQSQQIFEWSEEPALVPSPAGESQTA
ncbi:MAG: hypothetical protein RIC55_29635 [Pirellulaceae bacterium]